MQKKETINCGSGTKKSESWLSVTINPDVINQYIQEYNGKKFVKLNVNINETPNKFGKDVSISIDTWTPNGELKPRNVEQKQTEAPAPITTDDMPW